MVVEGLLKEEQCADMKNMIIVLNIIQKVKEGMVGSSSSERIWIIWKHDATPPGKESNI
jgi:hypothetical protein